jgi:hypothetical protein
MYHYAVVIITTLRHVCGRQTLREDIFIELWSLPTSYSAQPQRPVQMSI